jgi:hypothetical protein
MGDTADAAQAHTDAAGSVLSQAGQVKPPEGGAAGAGGDGTILGGAAGKDGDAGAGGAKAGDQAGAGDQARDKGPAKAPEKYEAFALPDGVTADQGMVEAFTPVARELGLSQEQAQKLVTLYATQTAAKMTAAEQAQARAVQEQRAGWVREFKASPTWQEDAMYARRAVEHLGDDATKSLLMGTWLGDHPVILRFLSKVGRTVAEDPGAGGGGAGGGQGKPDLAGLFYPTMARK